MSRQIAFLGVGTMGQWFVRNLLKAGHQVAAYDVNPAAAAAVGADGARVCASVEEAVAEAEIVCTSVPRPEHFEAAVSAALPHLRPGTYVVDFSTTDPGTTRRVHARAAAVGVRTLDAPVSGGPQGARAATLTLMVGGDPADFAAVQPVLQAVGKNIFHVGGIGVGQVVKICNNMVAAVNTVAVAEALITGVKAGADADVLAQVMRVSSGGNWILENFILKTVLQGDYTPRFALDLMHKDLGLFLKTADENSLPTLTAGPVYSLYSAARAAGLGPQDCTAVARKLEELAGQRIKEF